MLKKIILFYLFSHLLFSQIIDHNSEKSIYSNIPLNIELFTDYDKSDVFSLNIFYKLHNQDIYVKDKLNELSSNYYGYVIPGNFINGKYIEYYFLLELTDGSFVSFPEENPHNAPISVRIDNMLKIMNIEKDYLDADYNIISPGHQEKVLSKDLVISLSYFGMVNMDLDNIKIFLNDIDVSLLSHVRENNIAYIPDNLEDGKYDIKVILSTTDGIIYNPVEWSFYVVDNLSLKRDFSLSGKFWNDYNDNQIDEIYSATNTSNLHFQINSDWLDVKGKIKKSSLENSLLQAKDRYSLDINVSDLFNVNLGDFYPNINEFVIKGNRVRGIGINYESNLFQIDVINGELARSVQGSSENGVIISDQSSYFICTEYYACTEEDVMDPSHDCFGKDAEDLLYDECIAGNDNDYINISRNEYTFSRDVFGLRLGYGKKSRMNFGFSILKAKDDIETVNQELSNSIITLPHDMEIFSTSNSDQCIDFNNDGECTTTFSFSTNEPVYSIDYNDDGVYDAADTFTEFTAGIDTQYFISYDILQLTSSIYIDDCTEYVNPDVDPEWECVSENTYSLIREVWDIKIAYEDLVHLLDVYDLDELVHLSDQWGGDKPKDNVVIGTDFSLTSKQNNFRVKSSLAVSLYNENIWDGGLTNSQIDALLDGYEDCYIQREYINEFPPEDDYYWEDCSAYTNDGVPIVLIPDPAALGISIEDFPDLEDYTDFFMFTVDNIPFPYVVDKIKDGESVTLSDILNSPDVAYDLDFSLKVLNQHINFGLKQVGESFYTLGNPYMRKDMNEKYFNNSIRMLNNRLFLILKWNKTTNGLLLETQSVTDKYNMNASYYPGIDLPSFSLSMGKHYRESGELSEGYQTSNSWDEILEICTDNVGIIVEEITSEQDCIISGTYDTRVNTVIDNYNFSMNHKFNFIYNHNISFSFYNSLKRDQLYHDLGYTDDGLADTSYISPKSKSNNFNINLRTNYNYKWESYFQFSRSYFDYAQEISSYYQVQRISSLSSGFAYKTDFLIDRIGAGLDYSKGTGTNEYNQMGLKLFANLHFTNNLNLILNYTHKSKNVENDDDYNNSLFKANLSYRF